MIIMVVILLIIAGTSLTMMFVDRIIEGVIQKGESDDS